MLGSARLAHRGWERVVDFGVESRASDEYHQDPPQRWRAASASTRSVSQCGVGVPREERPVANRDRAERAEICDQRLTMDDGDGMIRGCR